jgi:YebC/PmpR family DNA-binding regulatory protein
MAGHSKFANIKHRKGAQDAKREKLFTKLMRAVRVAAKMGGPDPDANARLRDAIIRARAGNVPKDRIERALKAQDNDDTTYEEITYEGYGPAGVAILVECLTDNRNRTASDVRHAFTRNNGNLGTTGSVAYLFERRGILSYPPGTPEEKIMDIALEHGAQDITTHDDTSLEVITTFVTHQTIEQTRSQANLPQSQADITLIATNQVTLDQDNADKLLRMIDTLEDLDDVQNVYSNADISDDVLAALLG